MARFTSSVRNTMAYVIRAERKMEENQIDRHIWDFRRPYMSKFDQLQMALLREKDFSCEPEDCLSGAMGYLVSAENLEEEAEKLAEKADIERRKAKLFREFAGEDARFWELASDADETAEDMEEEADRLYGWAGERKSWGEYYTHEAEMMIQVRSQLSGWYSIFE